MAREKTNDGGPAFPGGEFYDERQVGTTAGMTLRDWFAGQALRASHFFVGDEARSAEEFYLMADAMLEARRAKS